MAKRIKVGSPVNDAEAWGFDFLEQQLPKDWLLITNVELPASTGQLLEIDAIVMGSLAIYLVDIKGYSGQLSVDANIWLLDDRRIDNPLSKANQMARIYASRIRESLRPGEHAPWCQGAVFVTGHRGTSLSLHKSQQSLSVFGPDSIVAGLTDEEFVTSQYKHALTAEQKERAIDVLGRLGRMPDGTNEVAGFNRVRNLGSTAGIDQCLATANLGDLRSEWILKEVDLTSGTEESQLAAESLKAEYVRYQQLLGVPGLATCAPLTSDGERMILPIRHPTGVRLESLALPSLSKVAALTAFRTFLLAVEQFEARGLEHAIPSLDDFFVDAQGNVTLFPTASSEAPESHSIDALKSLWSKLESTVQSKAIADWFREADEDRDYGELRFLIAAELSGKVALEPAVTILEEGELLLGRYRLELKLEDRGGVTTWQARHEAGKFPLVCTAVEKASERWHLAQRRLAILMQTFHPGIERVFDIEHLPEQDMYLVSRAWGAGEPLESLSDPGLSVRVLVTALEALGYIHGLDLLHRRICPENILVEQGRAILVALSALPSGDLSDSIPGYVNDSVVDEGWNSRSDLWALIKSFTDSCGELLNKADPDLHVKLKNFVEDPDSVQISSDYVVDFGLQSEEAISVLPTEFTEEWGISKGYMTFLVLDMLNDGQPRSRNQIVLNALRSRHISGNKTNKGSMSATVSRLKAAGIAEDHGKKIRLTDDFLKSWSDINR